MKQGEQGEYNYNMELLSEFFDKIPMAAMIAAVFAIIFILAITRIFKMPQGFEEKEQVRMELRLRLAEESEAAALAEKQAAELAAQEKEKPPADAAQPEAAAEAGKPPETAAAKP